MLDVERIRSIVLLRNLNESMLKKVAERAVLVSVKPGEYLFKEGDYAEHLFSVLEGKVALEVQQNSSSAIRIMDILPTRSFGISSLVDTEDKLCISHAKAIKDSKLVKWKAADLEKLFHEDYHLGFLFIKRVGCVLKNRLQAKNAQMASILETA